mmetsp:Transcript_2181/g.3582  ORF Transcript_2181/g.3582 Transcript_2181/m.3582 type:complete len:545 (+) Transcript_2181:133-1767(+)
MISRRRQQQLHNGRKQHHHRNDPSNRMPRLVKANSGSTSSSDSPTYPVTENGKNRRTTRKKQHHHHHHPRDSTDDSILKGAEILRRELSDGGPRRSQRGNDHDQDSEDWDPWIVPNTTCSLTHENREEGFSDLVADAAYWANRATCDGDDVDDVGYLHDYNDGHDGDEEDTLHIIERAKALYNSSLKLMEPKQKQIPMQNGKENSKNYVVERVSEMDNRTFDSLFQKSYLPNELLPAACGSNDEDPDPTDTHTVDFLATLHLQRESSAYSSVSKQAAEQKRNTQNRSMGLQGPSRSDRLANVPRVTAAAAPFEKMVAPSSYFYDELLRDPAYRHALQAGILWQSLCSQHVRFPALWWDGQERAGPPLGCPERQLWSYLGRHRVKGDRKLNSLIGNRGSSGRLLLHLVVRDSMTFEPIEDVCCGCFHPNARGIRTTQAFNPQVEDCRDIWIGHRRRVRGECPSTIESVLRSHNKGRTFASPLGGEVSSSKDIHNGNLKAVFGEKPPLFTVFVTENDLFEIFQNSLSHNSPASVVLLRQYLRHRIG